MTKYGQLGAYLRADGQGRIAMTFVDIEGVLGTSLPPSAAHHRAWWSNNPTNNVATKEWLDAGYVTEQVDLKRGTVVFRRVPPTRVAEVAPPTWATGGEVAVLPKPTRHPLFGALKGFVLVAPGADLTEPADPDWGTGD